MTYWAGWTPSISRKERATNEVNSCLAYVTMYPDSEYWQRRLAHAYVDEYNEYHLELDDSFLYERFALEV